jgi:branched-chain amino acid transport system ATP-binding protein
MTVLLETADLTCRFGGVVAVRGINVSVRAGDVHGLIGPNGAGKTTFLNLISGHIRQTSGAIQFDGKVLGNIAPERRAAAGIRRTFQNLRLFREMTTRENVMVGLHADTRSEVLQSLLRTGRQQREEREIADRARGALEFVGLLPFADALAGSLTT